MVISLGGSDVKNYGCTSVYVENCYFNVGDFLSGKKRRGNAIAISGNGGFIDISDLILGSGCGCDLLTYHTYAQGVEINV